VKKMGEQGHSRVPVSPGRPRVQLEDSILLELKGQGYGYKRIASEYTRLTGQYVSHTTVRDRLMRAASSVCGQPNAVLASSPPSFARESAAPE